MAVKRKNTSFRKTKKAWKKRGHNVTSSKASKRGMRGAPKDPGPVKMRNPPKGWIPAKAVRVVKRNGKTIVEVKR